MNNFLGPGVVLTTLFVAAGYTIYTFIKANHLERMARIERGMETESNSNKNQLLVLKVGMLMIGVSFGLLLAYTMEVTLNIRGEVFYPAFTLLFGGISLIASYFWSQRLSENR